MGSQSNFMSRVNSRQKIASVMQSQATHGAGRNVSSMMTESGCFVNAKRESTSSNISLNNGTASYNCAQIPASRKRDTRGNPGSRTGMRINSRSGWQRNNLPSQAQ